MERDELLVYGHELCDEILRFHPGWLFSYHETEERLNIAYAKNDASIGPDGFGDMESECQSLVDWLFYLHGRDY